MKIQSMTLKNIGHFKDLTIPFAPLEEGKPRVTVFIGNNGSGKTNILKSLVTALSWLPARIRTERGRGLDIPEEVIHNDEHSAAVSVNVLAHNQEFVWTLSKAREGKKNQFSSDLKAVSEWADIYRTQLTENQDVNLPLMVFYPVERSVLDIPLKIKAKHYFEQLDAYDNALEMGVDFRRFFEWFRAREDIDNEERLFYELEKQSQDIDRVLELWERFSTLLDETENLNEKWEKSGRKDILLSKQIFEKMAKLKLAEQEMNEIMENKEDTSKLCLDVPLKSVKQAIKEFTDFENIWVQRKPKLRMMVSKNGKEFNVFQLSQGEKSLMALVGDIAQRLAMLNPNLDNPLEGQGVIMIDEADLHLHPQWQRQLIDRLTKTFPNCQFILSTHSPLVISDSKDIVVYSLENGEMSRLPSQYGQDANMVLLNAMDTAIRNEKITEKINHLIDLIQDNQLSLAKEKLAELRQELPENHLELNKAQLLLKKQEIRHEKNSEKPRTSQFD
ncbi:AAA family ATPase [Wielerella bovis]|uniref:AAA family ATPase n=1 Tax=Wielerella bovis TaxID=2917790 RepID=UPI0020190166|nr:AAA family ATPase [Wielerella bovis]ULJ68784.1 AAA family ATPase [Wielerella bovis]